MSPFGFAAVLGCVLGGGRKALGLVVDVVVVLILVVVGVFLGELLANKSTREILDGASGPKFPQLELLMWLAPPVVFVLVYEWLSFVLARFPFTRRRPTSTCCSARWRAHSGRPRPRPR